MIHPIDTTLRPKSGVCNVSLKSTLVDVVLSGTRIWRRSPMPMVWKFLLLVLLAAVIGRSDISRSVTNCLQHWDI